ncbi:MAG: response regulator, partial [Oxalobacteraceae bacterium]
ATAATARFHGGTGLGLAICKRLTELMGGTLQLISRPGEGSTFFFELPLVPVNPAEVNEPLPSGDVEALSGLRALVVDDDPVARDIMRRYLHGWQIEAQDVGDGPAALTALQRAQAAAQPFEVVFIDKVMPEMDGMDLARKVASQAACKQPRLVLVSSFERSVTRNTFAQAGFVAFLPKPLKQSQLFDCLIALRHGAVPALRQRLPSAPTPRRPGGKRILVAEDNPVNTTTCCSWTVRCRRWTATRRPRAFASRRRRPAAT